MNELDERARWDKIVEAVEAWPSEQLQAALPQLQELLSDDTSDRSAPKRWLTFGAKELRVHPAFYLARSLHLDQHWCPFKA